jgi:hypothetical protein
VKCTVTAVPSLTYGCKPELSKDWTDKIEAIKIRFLRPTEHLQCKLGWGGGPEVRMSTYGLMRMKEGRLSDRFCNANHQKERNRPT